jgi:hypothetical protein
MMNSMRFPSTRISRLKVWPQTTDVAAPVTGFLKHDAPAAVPSRRAVDETPTA